MIKISFATVIAAMTLVTLACVLTAPAVAQVGAESVTPTAMATKMMILKQVATLHPASTCTVTATHLHLRAAAGTDALVIGYLNQGDILTLTNLPALGNWQNVITSTGTTGWVNMKYCRKD